MHQLLDNLSHIARDLKEENEDLNTYQAYMIAVQVQKNELLKTALGIEGPSDPTGPFRGRGVLDKIAGNTEECGYLLGRINDTIENFKD